MALTPPQKMYLGRFFWPIKHVMFPMFINDINLISSMIINLVEIVLLPSHDDSFLF